MNLKEFDDILKQKLGEIPVEKSMPNWDRMNRELDDDSVKDQIFDEQVNRKLQQLNVHNFAKPSWNSLYELIDKRIQNKRRVIVTKSFELLMVLLLFFTAYNLGTIPGSVDSNQIKQNSNSTSIYAEVLVPENKENLEGLESNYKSNSINNQVVDDQSVQERTAKKSPSKTRQTFNSNQNVQLSLAKTNFTHTHVDYMNLPLIQEELILETEALAQTSAVLSIRHLEDIPDHVMKNAFPKDFSSSSLDEIALSEINNESDLNDLPIPSLKSSKNSNWFISSAISLQTNQIESASFKSVQNQGTRNVLDSKNAALKSAFSSSGSLKLGYSLANVEFISGVELQRIKYSPDVILTSGTLSSFSETYIEDIQYDFLSIPLELNAAVYGKKSWKIRIHTGFITSFLLDAKESISQKITRGERIIEIPFDEVDRSVFNFAFQEGILSRELKHGSEPKLKEAIRYKASIGLGISKKIGNRTEIFGRTDYLYQIPTSNILLQNVDLINTLSLSFGVKQYLS